MVLTCIFLVELPGIEPGTYTGLTCEKPILTHAKRRQSTRKDLRIRQRC